MRRHMIRPYGQSISPTRALSLIMLLALLWMAWGWVKNPAIWHWIAKPEYEQQFTGEDSPVGTASQVDVVDTEEAIVPGPNDTDRVEAEGLKSKLDLVTDKAPLRLGEMPMYWKLLEWSRTESFEKLKGRAAKGVPFSQIYQEPSEFRGQLMHLRLHVRRVLRYKPHDNPLKLQTVYEAWGWTDDSKSYPYVIVFSERPPGLPIGTDVRAELEFVGYFLKVMSYTAYDVPRGAPLLIGRVKVISLPAQPKSIGGSTYETLGIAAIGLTALVGISVWQLVRRKKGTTSRRSLPDELALDMPFETKPDESGSTPKKDDPILP